MRRRTSRRRVARGRRRGSARRRKSALGLKIGYRM